VNASPTNLAENGFDRRLIGFCERAGVAPAAIELEFTEGTLAADARRTRGQLEHIRAAGASVAIDDFGAGYSNMGYLTLLPADVLKIDRSFVRPGSEGRTSDLLLRHIVELAKDLGFRVVAEGIETPEALDRVRRLGCDEGQGYFVAKPMAAQDFGAWISGRANLA
jgi:EAL domain-containing protein (putative c-di-GMP-specific phosphodiesterase class I)